METLALSVPAPVPTGFAGLSTLGKISVIAGIAAAATSVGYVIYRGVKYAKKAKRREESRGKKSRSRTVASTRIGKHRRVAVKVESKAARPQKRAA